MNSVNVVIALGSNLGDPVSNLRDAVSRLQDLALSDVVASSIWKSAPVGFVSQVPEFCNAVALLDTDLTASELLASLKTIERDMGRLRDQTPHYESRAIDLDIVDYNGVIIDEPGLTLPHPRAHERLFVLLPLQELLPRFVFPGQSDTLDQLIRQAPDSAVERSIPLIPLD